MFFTVKLHDKEYDRHSWNTRDYSAWMLLSKFCRSIKLSDLLLSRNNLALVFCPSLSTCSVLMLEVFIFSLTAQDGRF